MRNSRNFKKTIVSLIMAFVMAFVPMTGTGTMTAYAIANGTPVATNQNDDVDRSKAEVNTAAEEAVPDNSRQGSEQKSQAKEESSQNSVNKDKAEAKEAENYVKEEATKSDNQEDATKPDDTESDQTRSKYQWQDDHMKVTAVLEDPSAIPDDAELVVKAISEGSKGYNYDAYMEALNSNSESKYDGNNTLLYDVAFIKDGVELQPESGTVSVTFEFLDEQLSDSIGAKKTSDVNVIHLPLADNVKEQYDTTADATDISADDINVEKLTKADNSLAVSVKNEKAVFETDSFSVFAYTVDFEFNGYQFSIPGGSEIKLSKVFEQLNIDKKVKDVKEVTFSNPDLVEVKAPSLLGNDWTLVSKKAFSTVETLTVVMNDGEKIEIKVTDAPGTYAVGAYFVGYDDEDIKYDGSQNFVVYAEIKSKETGEIIGWNTASLDTSQMTPYCYFPTFGSVSNEWSPDNSITFDPALHTASTRLYTDNPAPTYHNVRNAGQWDQKPVDNFDGYNVFKNETNAEGTMTMLGIQKAYDKKFYLNVEYDPSVSTEITSGDNYYLFVDVDHQSTGHTYYLEKLVSNGESTQLIPVNEWKDNNGQVKPGEKFTGNEKSVTVKIIKGKDGLSINNAIAGTNCSVVSEGGAVKDYSVSYDDRNWVNDGDKKFPDPIHDASVHIDEYEYNIKLTKIDATNDYNFKSILGPGLYYGISAETFDQGNHIQSNFATNYYDGHNNVVEADLASNSGAIVMSDAKEYDGNLINIGESHSGHVLLYTNGDEDCLVNPRDFVTVINDSTQNLKDNFVDPIINYGSRISSELLTHPATLNVSGHEKLELDTTAFPENATIYIDGDSITKYLSEGKLMLKKHPNQVIVFNFDETTKLTLGEFYVQYPDMSGYSSDVTVVPDGYTDNWIKSDTPTKKGDKNDAIDDLAQHLVWNCNSVTDLTLGMTTGMYLVPNVNSYTNTAQTSSGWIITGGTFHNSGGEWHSVYSELPDVDETTINAKKMVDGKTPTIGQKFEFKIEKFDGNDWSVLTEKLINDGGAINYTDKLETEGGTLKEGWNIYRISEVKKSDDTPGTYKIDKAEFYAAVKYTVYGQGGSTVGVASLPRYFKSFAEEEFDNTADDPKDTGLSEPVIELPATFRNTTATNVTVDKQWSDGNEKHSSDTVKVKLQQKIGEGEWSDTIRLQNDNDEWEDVDFSADDKLITINAKSKWHGEFKNLPVSVPTGEDMKGDVAEVTYQVVEVSVNGETPDPDSIQLTLVPSPSGIDEAGNPISTVSYAFTLINNVDTKGEIKVRKVLDGREWTDDDFFTFTVSADKGTPMPESNEITIRKSDKDQTKSFGAIDFTEPGTYTYIVKETKGDISGITYDETEHTVTIKVIEDEDGNLVADTDSSLIQTVTVTNTAEAAEAEGEILVQKVLQGREWTTTDSFAFQISAAEGTPMPAETSITITQADKDQTKSFGKIKFTEEGTYTYTVKETTPDGSGIDCDNSDHTVTIEVVKNDKGELVAKDGGSLIKTETITNTYKAEGQALFSAKKAGDATLGERTFTFQLLDADKKPIETSQPVKQGEKVDFTAIKYDLNKLGDHTYYIKEVIPEDATEENEYTVDGVTYDPSVKTVNVNVTDNKKGSLIVTYDGKDTFETPEFKNSYAAKGEGEVLVQKVLEGRNWTTDDKFEFTITPVDGAPAFKTNTKTVTSSSKDYTESFGKVEFTKAGTYQWKVTEEHKGETIDGVAYDGADKLVTIEVKDDGKGHLVPETGSALVQTATFTNTYSESGEGEIKVQKNLEGRKWETTDSFKFTITPVGDAPKLEKDEVTVTSGSESYTESFGKVKFTKAGTYKWTVTEEHQGQVIDGIKYVSEPKTVTIVVKKDGKGQLVPETGSALVQTAEFTNEYSAKGEGEVKVQKVLEGRKWTDNDSFAFQISAAEGTPMPAATSINITKADKDQTKSFGKIEFTKEGTYIYTVKETTQSGNGITCDTTEHTVTIEVVDNGKGKLVAKEGDTLIKTEKITNTYKAEGQALFSAKKAGDATLGERTFTFQLLDADKKPIETSQPVKQGEKVDFTAIKYDLSKLGDHTYYIKEVIPEDATADNKYTVDGVTYDTNVEKVTVKVSDNGDGTLGVTYNGKKDFETPAFTNSYAAKGEGEVKVQKVLKGREWTDDDSFTFEISAAKGTPMPAETSIDIAKADKDQTKSFGKIEFTKAGTYTYTVKETTKDGDGIDCDTTEHTVTIEVVDNGKGELVAKEDDTLIKTEKITNTYSAKGEGEVKVQKVLEGRKWTDNDSFAFQISAAEGTPMPADSSISITKADKDQTKSFGKIEFKKAGTYTYKVKETKGTLGGVSYDEKEHTVTIEAVDDGNGNIVAKEGSKLIQTEEFTNTYAAEGTGEIKVKKTLTGRDWTNDDEFTFTISADEGTPLPADRSITIKKADKDQTKSFGEIKFKKAGTYTYKVKETKGTLGGVSYDEKEHTVTIEAVDDGNGNIVAKEGSKLIQTEEFTNTYAAEGTGEIKVKKTLTGRDWTNDDEFTFTISADEGTPLPADRSITIKKADKDQTKSFGEIKFKKAGTYTYKVKETKGTLGGVSYDEKEHTVTIEAVDDGNGNIVAKEGSKLIQTEEFTNTYAAEGTGEIKVKKTLTGRDWTNDDEFTFTISADEGTPLPADRSITIKKADKDQTKSFGEIKFKKAGTYTYKVKETKGTLGGVSYDEKEHTVTIEAVDDGNGNIVAKEGSKLIQTEEFTNTYAAEGTGEIKVKKTLTGRDWTNDDEFTFTISADEGTPLPADTSITIKKADRDQTKSFGEIKFTKAGTYTYKVKETKGTLGGVTYDTTEHTVTIEAVDDGNGNIVAKEGSKLIQTEEFTNTYAAEGTGEIKVKKTLTGRDWTNDDEFTFTISADEGTPLPADRSITIKKADKDQTKSFGEIKFKKAGTYTYKVKETKGTLGGVSYDEKEHTVTIEAVDDGKGHIVAKEGSKLIQTEEFTNTYAAEGTGEIKVKKTLEGRKWTADDEFEFTLSGSGNAPMPEEDTIVITKDDKDRTVSFGKIDFDEPGKYTYTVKETKGDSKGVTYDTKKHKVTIEVVDDGNGNLVAKKGTKLIQTVKITNVYKEAGGTRTGDDTNLVVSVLILLSSVLALLIIVVRRRRSKSDC